MNIKNHFKAALAAVALLGFSVPAQADFVFAGTWDVADGPVWSNCPAGNGCVPVSTAQEIAALLFGGVASDYAISTVNDVNAVDFMAWYSIWGGPAGIFAQNYLADGNGNGRYDNFGDSSAYVQDHCGIGQGGRCINHAFRIVRVVEPGSTALLGLGLLSLGLMLRRRRSV